PGAFEMTSFTPRDSRDVHRHGPQRLRDTENNNYLDSAAFAPRLAIRRFRVPIPARVRVDLGIPVRVTSDRRGLSGGRVETYAGPWRTSGGWWVEDTKKYWERDEWDVTLSDGATYRIFRERDTDAWFVEGVVD